MTDAMLKALRWLAERGGSAAVTKYGHLFAAGETAPFADSTWLRLVSIGCLAGNDHHLILTAKGNRATSDVPRRVTV